MIHFPNAKINIGLSVLNKRTDGFHNITTVLYPIPYFDVLEVFPAKGTSTNLSISGVKLDAGPGDNLCYKAWLLFQREYGIAPVDIYLYKAIPPGADLGGGSSDGAATLRALDDLSQLDLDDGSLEVLASQLGSDCPFFIQNSSALACGKGDELRPLDLDLEGYYLVLVKPPLHISTAAAYARVTPSVRADEPWTGDLVNTSMTTWKENIVNDFEEALFGDYPVLREMKDKLYRMGAIYASMTGSGSAVYGLFSKQPGREHLFTPTEVLWQGWL